jgi:hypothetical protein
MDQPLGQGHQFEIGEGRTVMLMMIAMWLVFTTRRRAEPHYPLRTVKVSMHGRPMLFAGPLLADMMTEMGAR